MEVRWTGCLNNPTFLTFSPCIITPHPCYSTVSSKYLPFPWFWVLYEFKNAVQLKSIYQLCDYDSQQLRGEKYVACVISGVN